jgi:hypothetical protein
LTSSTIETLSSKPETEETLSFGTSIRDPRQLRQNLITNLGISKVPVEPTTCKCGAPTQDGSKSSLMLMSISATLKTRSALMLQEAKMLKVKLYKFMEEPTIQTKDGRLCMLTKLTRLPPKDLIRSLVGKSIDHSILFQTCQCIELLRWLDQMCNKGDMSRIETHNSGTMMESLELLDPNNIKTIALKFKAMEDQQISE